MLLLLFAGCFPQHWYQVDAPPVAKTVALIEADPGVRQALGDDVSVSLAVTRTFERDWLYKQRAGVDRVYLITTVTGSNSEADLTLSATDIGEQGWAGTFELRRAGKQVLRDGAYVTEGAEVVMEGTFAADGAPVAGAK